MVVEKRKFVRKYLDEPVHVEVSVLNPETAEIDTLEGFVNDEGSEGIGIKTHSPIEPGKFVRVMNGHGEKKGLVVWHLKDGSDKKYRSGIKLL